MTSLVEKILSNSPLYALINVGLIIAFGIAALIIQTLDLIRVDWTTKAYLGRSIIVTNFMLVVFCFIFASNSLIDPSTVGAAPPPWQIALSHIILYSPIIFAFHMLSQHERMEGKKAASLSFLQTLAWVSGGVFATLIVNYLVNFSGLANWIIYITQSPSTQQVVNDIVNSQGIALIGSIILTIIIIPILEECFFRGLITPSLKRVIGRWPGIILSSLLFGIIHCSLPQFIALSFIGVLLCLAHERAKSIWLPILIHACFNGINIIAMFMISK